MCVLHKSWEAHFTFHHVNKFVYLSLPFHALVWGILGLVCWWTACVDIQCEHPEFSEASIQNSVKTKLPTTSCLAFWMVHLYHKIDWNSRETSRINVSELSSLGPGRCKSSEGVPFLVAWPLPLSLQCWRESLTMSEMNFWAASVINRTLRDGEKSVMPWWKGNSHPLNKKFWSGLTLTQFYNWTHFVDDSYLQAWHIITSSVCLFTTEQHQKVRSLF